MKKIDFSILSIDQLIGQNKLSIIDKMGTSSDITYFAQILGASSTNVLVTKSLYSEDRNYLVKALIKDKECYCDINSSDTLIRPTVKYSDIKNYIKNKTINENGVLEVNYGEFPSCNVSKELYNILETQYNKNLLYKTNQKFTTFESHSRYDFNLEQSSHDVYIYNSEKYIRIIGRFNSYSSNYSNTILWIKVCPITWIVDEKNDLALSKDSIFSGIPFNDIRKYSNNFNETLLYRYLNQVFSKEICYNPCNELSEISNIIKPKEINIEVQNKKIENVLKYYLICDKLRTLIRKGWKDYNIQADRLESVAEHIYSTQMLALGMINEFKYKVNMFKVIFMLAIHEVGEAIIGDITYKDMDPKEKRKIELDAVHKIFGCILNGDYIEQLFLEYEFELSNEGKFAKQCDKLQADIMAKCYEEEDYVKFIDIDKYPELKKLKEKNTSLTREFIEHDKKYYDKNFNAIADYILNNDIKRLILK